MEPCTYRRPAESENRLITFHVMTHVTGVTVLISNDGEARQLGDFDSRAVADTIVKHLRDMSEQQQTDLWEMAR